MSKTQTRSYRATIILNTRDLEESADKLLEKVSQIFKDLGAEIAESTNLGRFDFVRVTDKKHTGDSYLSVSFSGKPNVPADFQEKVRLDRTIKSVMIQSA